MPTDLNHKEGMLPFYWEQVLRWDWGKLHRDLSRDTYVMLKGSKAGPTGTLRKVKGSQ